MDRETRQALEAILFVVEEPVDVSTLCQVLEVGREQVEDALLDLARQLEDEGRGFVLRPVAGGWRLYTAPAAAPYLERWVLAGRSGRLTQASLETLSVIAYKQPITRHEISEIRGVNADGAVRTLVSRGLVHEVGRDEGPGQAILYGTTTEFLEKVGLRSLDELPALTDFLPEGPAPDEPAPGDLRAARERLQAGGDLSSTGRGTWDPTTETPLPEPLSRREREQEMDSLTDALEQAARSAMATLEQALGVEDEDDGADDPASSDT